MSKLSLYLHGRLKTFGGPYQVFACHAAEAISALSQQIAGFEATIAKGKYQLISGAYKSGKILKGLDCYQPLQAKNLHIVPIIAGAASRQQQALLGLSLLGLSFVPGLSGVAGARAGSQLLGQAGGVLMLRALQSASFGTSRHSAQSVQSDIISAPSNVSEGKTVPLLYGRRFVQSPPIIFSSLTVEIEKL